MTFLEIDTGLLVAAYRAQITLSPINSGATFALGPAPRGPDTFRSIGDYDYDHWRKRRPCGERVVELTIEHAVPDIAGFVRRVGTVRGGDGLSTLAAPG